ncbi:sugar phosphate isomerase/epimerase family protein [Flavihumibacter stibioxidans]|uniref:Xylose isomerase n=1 Tax=Flavihumibacter stibioxidans TaxID=1834163 RepID=A0ABR7M9Z0_9BACT|nr:sugar phosphate isomerase/epimerase family protein [Flavihumibacter stibioxidans]MBC6491840.1 xylose isomerase [Flavihumibacter stibioxidans]
MKTKALLSQLTLAAGLFLAACNSQPTKEEKTDAAPEENVTQSWNLGVELWTFHTFNFPDALDKVDSSGLTLIEASTFHKSGPALKDTLVGQLSPEGLDQLKKMVADKGITMGSMYLGGGKTVESWKKEFDVAKAMGVKFVTAEPPVELWDQVDSLAGAYGIKVAIHEHWKGVSAYWHPDSVLAAIQGHPNFGACADLGHWPKSGIDPVDGVKKLSGHIIAIHLKDIAAFNDPKLRDVPVGTGVVNFPGVFEELKKQGFKGNIYIEMDMEGQPSNLPHVQSTIKYYNEQVGKLK